jgi:molecular chaperone DnaK
MPAPRGVPKVEVTFDIDANGILSVHAKDTATGKDQRITITANSGLSEDQIKNMVKEAADHEAEDKERREQIDRRNKLDNLCYTLEKTMSENKDKLPQADVATLETIIKEARSAIEKQDDEAVKTASEKLEKEAHRLASVMYQGAAPGPGGPSADGPPPGDGAPPPGDNKGGDKKGGVIDAEFEETS